MNRHVDNGTGAKDVQAAIAQLRRTQPDIFEIEDAAKRRDTIAKEVIAVMAEHGSRNGLVQRVIAAVRKFLRRIMPSLKWSDAEVRDLLHQSERFLRDGTHVNELAGNILQFVEDKQQAFSANPQNPAAGGVSDSEGLYSRAPAASFEMPEPSALDTFIYRMQDKHVDTKRLLEALRKDGNSIDDQSDAYLREEQFHGRTAARTSDFINDELSPLLKAMNAEGVTLDQLEEYLHKRHAEEANKQVARVNPDMPDGGSGILTADARAYLDGLPNEQRAKLDGLARRVDAIVNGTRDLLVAYGLESQSTVDAWSGAYQHYVPLHRDLDNAHGSGIGQGFSVRGSASKRRTGSMRAAPTI